MCKPQDALVHPTQVWPNEKKLLEITGENNMVLDLAISAWKCPIIVTQKMYLLAILNSIFQNYIVCYAFLSP